MKNGVWVVFYNLKNVFAGALFSYAPSDAYNPLYLY